MTEYQEVTVKLPRPVTSLRSAAAHAWRRLGARVRRRHWTPEQHRQYAELMAVLDDPAFQLYLADRITKRALPGFEEARVRWANYSGQFGL